MGETTKILKNKKIKKPYTRYLIESSQVILKTNPEEIHILTKGSELKKTEPSEDSISGFLSDPKK